jgi:hypothetical protein
MRRAQILCAIAATAISGISIKCNNNPSGPADLTFRNVLFSEGFENGLTSDYRQVAYMPSQGMMSVSTKYARTGTSSLTSDSNNTGIKRMLDLAITDSIAGLQGHKDYYIDDITVFKK